MMVEGRGRWLDQAESGVKPSALEVPKHKVDEGHYGSDDVQADVRNGEGRTLLGQQNAGGTIRTVLVRLEEESLSLKKPLLFEKRCARREVGGDEIRCAASNTSGSQLQFILRALA